MLHIENIYSLIAQNITLSNYCIVFSFVLVFRAATGWFPNFGSIKSIYLELQFRT